MQIKILSCKAERDSNQDSLLINSDIFSGEYMLYKEYYIKENKPQIFAVADGMGGEEGGDIASSILMKTVKEAVYDKIRNSEEKADYKEIIEGAILKAQYIISEKFETENIYGGTTISLLIIDNEDYHCFSIGDSPIMIMKNGKLDLLNKFDTLAQRKMDQNVSRTKIYSEDFHFLTQAIGSGGYDSVHYTCGKIEKNTMFLVATDGIMFLKEKGIKKSFKRENLFKYIDKISKSGDNVSAIYIDI